MKEFTDDELKCLFKAAMVYVMQRQKLGKPTSIIEAAIEKLAKEVNERGLMGAIATEKLGD